MIEINSYSLQGKLLIQSSENVLSSLFQNNKEPISRKLTFVTPNPIIGDHLFRNDLWINIYQAWHNIIYLKKSSSISNWRVIYKYGHEVIPGMKLFKLRDDCDSSYFYLLNEEETESFSIFNILLFKLKAWSHIKNNRGFFHSAGIIIHDCAYLFLGPSGTGKSTISAFCEQLGFEVVHDDHVVVHKSENGYFYLSDFSSKKPQVFLKSIFFLIQDRNDKLVPLFHSKIAQCLFKSFFETIGEKILYGNCLINAFKFSSELARIVPGYELHFTKSLAFWKIIQDGNAL